MRLLYLLARLGMLGLRHSDDLGMLLLEGLIGLLRQSCRLAGNGHRLLLKVL